MPDETYGAISERDITTVEWPDLGPIKQVWCKVARWPHGCRRQCSEVAVPALVGSNLTEGGGFFPRKEPPPDHGKYPRVPPHIRKKKRGKKQADRKVPDRPMVKEERL
jgi:hypothetical protein